MGKKPLERKFNFTKKRLELLEPPKESRQIYYRDAQMKGLAFSVGQKGSKAFFLYRKIKGKPKRIRIGGFPEVTIEQARAKANEFNAAIERGERPDEKVAMAKSEPTLEDLFKEYFEGHIKKRKKTASEIEKSFERNFSHWKHLQAGDIKFSDVESLHTHIAKTRGKYAANRALELLRAIYNRARKWRLYKGDNPASGITEYKETPRERILNPDECVAFFTAINDEPEQDFKDFVLLLLLTGQRKSNVLSMSWDDIDMTAGLWTIPGELMKNDRSLSLKLTPDEMNILERRILTKENSFVFPTKRKGSTGHFVEPKKLWMRFLNRANIENLHMHDLRRSLASGMATTGAELAVIKNALNHKDIKTTMDVYTKTAKDTEMVARQKAHEHLYKAWKCKHW